ncbi:MAG: molybdopterin-dependent oxidoreductase [Bacteroidetes bacterium]|jgi:DMSO/TMAO reductase YedYZ molybdopterin-dependent catalytic subunit|nr:molybdopterin-dependent oxidoreductase [Bacteroidota bacterium]
MKKHLLTLAITCFCFIVSYNAKAQTASVKVSGEVTTPMSVNDDGLHKYTQTTVIRKDHDGKDHTYTGVILAEILKKAGATLGPDLKGKNLAKYILVTASDNYQVVFALAELDKAFTDRIIILADQVDGKPLPSGEGPFRVIVQDEKKPARCIREVTEIKVLSGK